SETIYRYRFQGQIFEEREGFVTSSDFGLSGRIAFPEEYGDVHVGIYNGDGYTHSEANDQKALQLRGSLRPAPGSSILKGLRLTAFYDADNYVKDGKKRRFIGGATFEHRYVNAGASWLDAKDEPTAIKPEVKGDGYTLWVTPRTSFGLEGLFRYDSLKPNKD